MVSCIISIDEIYIVVKYGSFSWFTNKKNIFFKDCVRITCDDPKKNKKQKRDKLESLERVFLLATITIETDSITIKMLRSFLFLLESPYRIIGFFLNTPARQRSSL